MRREIKKPEIIGFTTDEVNEFRPDPNLDYCFVNHSFNPLFFNLQKNEKCRVVFQDR